MTKLDWSTTILSIRDKNPYCRKLLYQLYHYEDEFLERRIYELSFALYARFFQEKLAPHYLVDYFKALQNILENQSIISDNPDILSILNLGLQLDNFRQYSEDNLQLTHIMLQINYLITGWQSKNHICKYCGHKLELLTQPLDEVEQAKSGKKNNYSNIA
ncbi:MAG: hypothetical protein HY817_02015 [Candidatus Abawacabacteria bacterium]|nr:hypothetical protein [Candidatus Abawacabacteria bacterium]